MQTQDNLERIVVYQGVYRGTGAAGPAAGGISEETQNDSCEKNTVADRVETAVGLSWKENRFRHRRRH